MNRPVLSPSARIGILNRGEAAVRLIRAVAEHNALYGTRLSAVAFYVPPDEDSPFVRQADEALPLPIPAAGRGTPYLNRELLLKALGAAECTAAWAGWGFLSEDARFVAMLEAQGLVFLGPSSAAMALLGDKIAAKSLAQSAGVPVVPWSGSPVGSPAEARQVVEQIGLPCIVKAAGTGGGRGIRAVHRLQELEGALASAREESLRVAGSDRVFIERLVERGRHLEVQVLADRFGTVQSYGVRDCSLQRRNQKIIEETPPAGLGDALLEAVEASAVTLARAAGYESAGTVEFLYENPGDGKDERHYFMEVNTRLQVEHPITEQAYGVDLVQGQIQVAMGGRISAERPQRQGVALEARLNAEDPERGFAPSPGRVIRLSMPSGPGVRVDSGVEQGSDIPPEFDSMIAKIVAFAPTRPMALARLSRALREMRLKIRGGASNRAFLIELLRQPEVQAGGVHTRYVEELLARGTDLISRSRWGVALAAAAVERYLKASREELANFQQQLAAGGYPRSISRWPGLEVALKAQGRHHRFLVQAVGIHRYHLKAGDALQAVAYLPREQEALFTAGNARHVIQSVERGDRLLVEVDGIPYEVEIDTGGTVRAPSPALVLSVPVRESQSVTKGEVLVVLEAMKMEMVVAAPQAGTVRELRVRPGEQVAAGQPLLVMESREPPDTEGAPEGAEGTHGDSLQEPATLDEQWSVLEQEYLSHFLGYDHDRPGQAALDEMLALAAASPELQGAFSAVVAKAVEAYADVERLFAGAPVSPEELTRPASFQELLSHYFRRQGEREKGLPEPFVSSLHRALRWYLPERATDDERTAALLRVYKSHADAEAKQELLRASLFALQRFPLPPAEQRRVADRLDEVALLSQLQNPSLSDAAINARYQLVDREALESWKREKHEKVGKILGLLARHRDQPRIYRRLADTLVSTGHHVSADLIHSVLRSPQTERALALEILGRRFTRDRRFLSCELLEAAGQLLCRVRAAAPPSNDPGAPKSGRSRSLRGKAVRPGETVETLVAVVAPESFAALLSGLHTLCAGAATPPEVVLLAESRPGAEDKEEALRASLAATPLPVRWVALGSLRPDGRQHFLSFAPSPGGGWQEDPSRRGINPRSWRELRLHRLERFEQELLYASESVHLLHLQARENPRDERLVALVEVPSSRVQRDEQGRIQRMVALESVFMEAVYAMRAEQARRKRRLLWNRIIIHLNTVLNTTLEQNREYASRLAAR
ncbi:MAG: ATP-grasp domain-containing protein, partial [Spirochaetales bacterium]|nr:ATP-grasp domain-containing protein [Spirochaetales bacterium]